jgi:Tfp pilus assembly protein PilZ
MKGEPHPIGPGGRALVLRFATADVFRLEYARNIVKGGAFIPTQQRLELRETVHVALEFAYRDESVILDAEVVHVIGPELARAGAVPGVAVQFLMPVAELRRQLGPLAEELARDPRSAVAAEKDEDFLDYGELDLDAGSDMDRGTVPAADAARAIEEALRPRVPRARRDVARVRTRLRTADGEREGRTRDVSRTGVLVSMDGNDLAVGQHVGVSLFDPFSGEELCIPGTVTRHVVVDGSVAAVAVGFDVIPGEHGDLARFVDQVTSADHTRRLGGVHGDLSEVAVATLVQMLGRSARAGTLTLRRGEEEGVVAFEGEALRYARLGALAGVKALARLLAWSDGRFEFHAHVDDLEGEGPRLPLDAALLEAAQHLDEAQRVESGGIEAGARLVADDSRAAAQNGQLGLTELAVLELARAGFSVRRALEVIPEPDARILAAIRSLQARGVLSLER